MKLICSETANPEKTNKKLLNVFDFTLSLLWFEFKLKIRVVQIKKMKENKNHKTFHQGGTFLREPTTKHNN